MIYHNFFSFVKKLGTAVIPAAGLFDRHANLPRSLATIEEVETSTSDITTALALPTHTVEGVGVETGSKTWKCFTSGHDQLVCANADQTKIRMVSKFSVQSWEEIEGDNFSQCETVHQDGVSVRYCVGEQTEFVEYENTGSQGPGVTYTLGAAATSGAVYAAFPEAAGDALYLSGAATKENAERVKFLINVAMILVTGSYLATGASLLVTSLLKYMGCANDKAIIAGNTVAFFVNTSKNFTPIGFASTAASYIGGRFGLWAEQQVVRMVSENERIAPQPVVVVDPDHRIPLMLH